MAPRTIYANLADGLQPFSLWDKSLADMGSLGIIPCTATGTNTVVLTPVVNALAPAPAYANKNQFSFTAAATSTGVITVNVGALGALPLYRSDAVTQATANDLVINVLYVIAFNAALNGGNGGFQQLTGGSSGASSTIGPPQGRLTLVSGVPVMGTSQAAKTSVIWTPVGGGLVPIYNGSTFVMTPVAEISQATTDTTKSPAAVGASQVFDMFVWNDAGTIRCTRGPAWTNATTRGYTLTSVNGIPLNTSAITNGPGASLGTWVGTVASNASSTIDFIYGAAGSGGVAGVFNVWNAYNQALIGCTVVNTAVTYVYASGTVRQAAGSAGMQVSWVNGSSQNSIPVSYSDIWTNTSTANPGVAKIGVAVDGITAFTNSFYFVFCGFAAGFTFTPRHDATINPGLGLHYIAALESGDTNANSFNQAGAGNTAGLTFQAWM